MTTPATEPPPASPTAEPPSPSIALCVLTAKVTSETGVFNCEHAGFWFPEWQAAEREVDAEIEKGGALTFDDADSALEHLRNL